jgi:hypothetical protein
VVTHHANASCGTSTPRCIVGPRLMATGGDRILNKDTYWKIVEQADRL